MPRVLTIPFAPILGDTRRNEASLVALAESIAGLEHQPDIVVFPELALSGYLLESLTSEVALEIDQIEALAQKLAECGMPRATECIIGFPLREQAAVFNAAAVLKNGHILHLQKKLFLPTYGMFDEGRYFARGQDLVYYAGHLGKTGILICEDAWHPELAFEASKSGAAAVIVISASPARGLRPSPGFASSENWRHRLKTYAESFGQAYVYCNRSGVEDGVLFDGTNFVLTTSAEFSSAKSLPLYENSNVYEISLPRPTFAGQPSR